VSTFHRGRALAGVAHHSGDVADQAALTAAAKGSEAIVHLAGKGDVGESRRDPTGYAQLNSIGTLHALQAAREAGASLLFASTQRVYPLKPGALCEDEPLAPDSPYGYAKWTAELWCRMASEQLGVPTTVLRFFSVYGPGQQANGNSGVVAIFARAALAGQALTVQSGGKRDFTDAEDVAEGIALALEKPDASHRVLNIATGVGTSFTDLARAVVRATGSRSEVREELVEPEGRDLVPDISRARAELGFEPKVSLEQGLERYIAWLRANP
jgi:nucleoside-diphosphate-sugar epimerase